MDEIRFELRYFDKTEQIDVTMDNIELFINLMAKVDALIGDHIEVFKA